MPHLSELHGAATHLAVVAVPVYVLLLVARRSRRDTGALVQAEPWALGAAIAGVAAAGATGLLVWGQAQTTLRGHAFRVGTAHFWLGIGLAALVVTTAAVRFRASRRGRPTHGSAVLAAALVALAVVFAQGYLGGRMTYDQGVGVESGGQFAQTARGATALEQSLAGGDPVAAGRGAFSEQGLGCARCHGDMAQGQRGPSLAGGVDVRDFRRVHGHGLFPRSVVTDPEFRALDAWLRTLKRQGRG